ncbi:Fibrinogen-like protein A [Holothuria leucospilota]|uniref:Fibrinogen-like protein A n=1 Tax=Holothuria leucospilota TaxID=206669 RepID=A0A9Q1BZP1_HOLLE|nr:Fibrinogen-like protein A [Holothuria leucospilota]
MSMSTLLEHRRQGEAGLGSRVHTSRVRKPSRVQKGPRSKPKSEYQNTRGLGPESEVHRLRVSRAESGVQLHLGNLSSSIGVQSSYKHKFGYGGNLTSYLCGISCSENKEYLTHSSARSGNKRAGCFPVVIGILFTSLLVSNVHSSAEGSTYFFYQQPAYPRDCQEVFEQCSTSTASGVYLIKPDGYDKAFEVYCDNQTDGGGWTVFQRRIEDNSAEFRRNFSEYRGGFGFLSTEFWLGNERLAFLTNQKRYQLRIDMTNSAGSSFYVTYNLFRISDDWGNYKITSVGQYGGTADTFFHRCPTNTIFGPCSCQGTCADPDGCHKSCTVEETCICPAGYLLSGSDCAPQEQCSCYDPTFGVIQNNESKFNLDCSEHCTCGRGTLTCDRNVPLTQNPYLALYLEISG